MKRNPKRTLLTWLLTAAMLLSLLPVAAFASTYEEMTLGAASTATITTEGEQITFSFTPDENATYVFYTKESGVDTYGYLYDASFNELAYNDDSGEGNNFLISYDLTAGETYYLAVGYYYYNSDTGTFSVYVDYDSGLTAESDTDNFCYVELNASLTLTANVSANDGTELTYQWYDSGEAIDGATSAAYTIDAVSFYGYYTCVVSDGYARSITFYYSVYVDTGLMAESDTWNTYFVESGTRLTLTAVASANNGIGLTYQWYDDEGEINGATSATYTINAVTSYGYYACVVSDEYGNYIEFDYRVLCYRDDISVMTAGTTSTATIANGGDVAVFSFTPDKSATYYFTSESEDIDTYGYLLDASFNLLTYNDDSGEDWNFEISYDLTAGETYYLAVRYYNSTDTGTFSVYAYTENSTTHTHSYTATVTKAATCTETGVRTYTCSCGASYTETIPATGHNWNSGEVTTPATRYTEGEKTYTCTVCGATRTETIAKLTGSAAQFLFTDVTNTSASYYTPVYWAYDYGITKGTSATAFSPSATCTRAQFVTFLWRLAGEPEPASSANPFTDVTNTSASYYKAVLWAVEQDITKGTSATTFSPSQTITRAQAVTFLYRYAGEPAVSASSSFTDVTNTSASYYYAVQWAVEKGITNGTTSTTFSPSSPCTRGQMVTFLYRFAVEPLTT